MPYNNIYTAPGSISRPTKLNPGGLCTITFFLWEDVEEWPELDPATDTIITELTMKAGKSQYTISSVESDRFFKEEMRRGNSGPYNDIQVNTKTGGNTTTHILLLKRYQHHQFGLILTDRNGEKRLIGDADSGAVLSFDYGSGDWNDQRGRQIKWQWQSQHPVPIYAYGATSSGIAITTEGGSDFITEDGQTILTE